MSEIYGTFSKAYVEAMRLRLSALEPENKDLRARVAELEARCKRMEEAAREVYLDSIASDHPWTELETRNMHALRDVLEDKP